MLALLLLQAATPHTAIEAERAFAAAAQAKGQWTAFREFAAGDAVMFVPETVKAQDWLKNRTDPPRSVEWQPAVSYVSCDGKLAVNTGNWRQPNGTVGYFTTVWTMQASGAWKWAMDHGDALAQSRLQPATPATVRAQCTGKPGPAPWIQYRVGPTGSGTSPDGTLAWQWHNIGAREVHAWLWNGQRFVEVINDTVAAPK